MRAPSRRNPGHSRAAAGVAGYNPGLLSTLADYSSSRKPDSPSDMAGPFGKHNLSIKKHP
jgi:hypothetical protein